MKLDRIMSESLEMEKRYKELENKIMIKLNDLLREVTEFNDIAINLKNNESVLKNLYSEDLKEIAEQSRSKNVIPTILNPFGLDRVSELKQFFKTVLDAQIEIFDGSFENIQKVYLKDKLEDKYPAKNSSNEVNKI